jgi:hypothetical protein
LIRKWFSTNFMPFGSWPVLILMAKSETGTIYVRCGLENQLDQRKSSSETDFAISSS